ncbi:hypothetical protein ACFW04_011264 [Cataglyphis niger]
MRVEEGRDLVPVADEDILRCLPFFLSGIALHWFRGRRDRLLTWDAFRSAWRIRFGDPDFQFALRDEITRRTQGEQESVADYLTCLRAMYDRLSPPWSAAEQISYALRNMLPRLQIAMRREEVDDLDALEDLATRIEASHQLAQRYRAPPTPDKSLFPDLAYRSPHCMNRPARRQDAIAALDASSSSVESRASSRERRMAKGSHRESLDRPSDCRAAHALLSLRSSGSNFAHMSGLFGKRVRESIDRGNPTPTPKISPFRVEQTQGEFSYSAFGGRDESSLLFLRVEIFGNEILALLDSGLSRTFMGPSTVELVERLRGQFRGSDGKRVTTATGQTTRIKGELEVPIKLRHRVESLKVYALPTLALPCILGVDFLSMFGIGVNFATHRWYFSGCSSVEYDFDTKSLPICCGLVEISSAEERRLRDFLASEIVGDPSKPGVTNLTEHRIDVGNHAPIKQRYYPVSPKIQEAIYAEVDRMLATGIIEPSKSEWSSPVVMIKKSNGTYRFCLDFRKLNAVSKKDAYPLPYMNSILDKLRAARYISTIDLSQAYFQIPLESKSRELTAFTVPGKGLFHFTRMPFGLTGAPATFQRLLDRLIGPEMEPHAFAYLDAIVIVTRTFEEHLIWLKRVLDRITEANLTINPEKSKFCRSQVKYLGFLVQKEGLKVDPDKTKPIVEYPPPKNIKQLRCFIGMASWYRRFIPQCATKLEPLTRLLQKNYSWEWEDEQNAAFESVKTCITAPPTLSCPKFELPFVLQTDASSIGLGAVLTQESRGGENVVAFGASRALSEAEKKYSTTEQECLAVVWAI